jgi:hypothetical protein
VPPAGVTVTAGYGSLTVSWGAVTADPAVTGYKVEVKAYGVSGGTMAWLPVTGSPFAAEATATTYQVVGLELNTSYQVIVNATNSAGDSLSNTVKSAKTLAAVKLVTPSPQVSATVLLEQAEAGTITLAVPSQGAVHLGTAAQQADGTFTAAGGIGATVTDTRPPLEQSLWNLQATVADFTPTSGGAAFSSDQLGSSVPVLSASTANALVTVGPAYGVGSQAGTRQLASGVNGASGTVNANLSLVVPKYTAEGSYTSVITMDLVKS